MRQHFRESENKHPNMSRQQGLTAAETDPFHVWLSKGNSSSEWSVLFYSKRFYLPCRRNTITSVLLGQKGSLDRVFLLTTPTPRRAHRTSRPFWRKSWCTHEAMSRLWKKICISLTSRLLLCFYILCRSSTLHLSAMQLCTSLCVPISAESTREEIIQSPPLAIVSGLYTNLSEYYFFPLASLLLQFLVHLSLHLLKWSTILNEHRKRKLISIS